MNLIDCLKNNAERNPTKIGFIDEEKSLTFKEMYEEVQKFSENVSKSVLRSTQVVSLISENSTSFVIAYLGIINSGRVVHLTPTNISLTNLARQTSSTGSGLILCPKVTKKLKEWNSSHYNYSAVPFSELAELTRGEKKDLGKIRRQIVAYLIYTSGTTGEPKGVPVSHDMVEFTTKNIIDVLGYSETDVDRLAVLAVPSLVSSLVAVTRFTNSSINN